MTVSIIPTTMIERRNKNYGGVTFIIYFAFASMDLITIIIFIRENVLKYYKHDEIAYLVIV